MTIYHNDHLGTPQKLTTASGVVVWSARYDAFGSAILDIHAVENNLRFPGQYYDAESGLHYNWNRYYDPELGRYITEDPILNPQVNKYIYSENNTLTKTDPFGLFCLQKAQTKCGSGAGKCVNVNWFMSCEFVCFVGATIVTKNPIASGVTCTAVCGLATAYKYYKCIKELKECVRQEMGKCCKGSKKVSSDPNDPCGDPTCDEWNKNKDNW